MLGIQNMVFGFVSGLFVYLFLFYQTLMYSTTCQVFSKFFSNINTLILITTP